MALGCRLLAAECLSALLLKRLEIFGGLSLRALDHEEAQVVDLRIVVFSNALNNRAGFEVPNNQRAVLRSRGHEAVALADGNVVDDVLVAVQRCLQDHGVLVPDFDDSVGIINLDKILTRRQRL